MKLLHRRTRAVRPGMGFVFWVTWKIQFRPQFKDISLWSMQNKREQFIRPPEARLFLRKADTRTSWHEVRAKSRRRQVWCRSSEQRQIIRQSVNWSVNGWQSGEQTKIIHRLLHQIYSRTSLVTRSLSLNLNRQLFNESSRRKWFTWSDMQTSIAAEFDKKIKSPANNRNRRSLRIEWCHRFTYFLSRTIAKSKTSALSELIIWTNF